MAREADGGEAPAAAAGGKVIDLADLLARSLSVAPANVPGKGLKKTAGKDEAEPVVEEEEAEEARRGRT